MESNGRALTLNFWHVLDVPDRMQYFGYKSTEEAMEEAKKLEELNLGAEKNGVQSEAKVRAGMLDLIAPCIDRRSSIIFELSVLALGCEETPCRSLPSPRHPRQPE